MRILLADDRELRQSDTGGWHGIEEHIAFSPRQIKTLFITSDSSAVAGVGPCLADALEHMDGARIASVVVCPHTSGRKPTILPRVEALGLPLFTRGLGSWLPSPRLWGAAHLVDFVRTLKGRVWSIATLIEEHGIDVVYSNGLPCIDGAIAARQTGRPHVWHLHEAIRRNPDLRAYLPARAIEETVARLSDAVIVNSSFLGRELRSARLRDKTRVIHNGVDLSALASSAPADSAALVRQELNIPAGAPVVLAVGTVAPRKGYDTLARAAQQVLARAPATVFLVAGAELADYAPGLRALIASLGLQDAFRLLGPRSDVPRLLAAADVLVHSARQETFGRVLVEAMALGKPVVATRSGGPAEIVIDGETGFLVPVDQPDALAQGLLSLIKDPALCARFGEAGRRRAAEHFSVAHFAAEVERVILAVAEKRGVESASAA